VVLQHREVTRYQVLLAL